MNITMRAYAKINLMLDITDKLDNGYHSLFMLMQSVGIFDTVRIKITDSDKITLKCTDPEIPCGKRNTAFKAAEAFLAFCGAQAGVDISIEKNIPHQAGLAGGSADAAAVIAGLNTLLDARLTRRELIDICLRVGSDVPFCLFGGTCLVQHSGGVVSELPLLCEGDCTFVLCKPDCGISTAEAYSEYDLNENIRHLDREGMLHAAAEKDFKRMFSLCDNVFEQVIDVPQRAEIKGIMRSFGSLACCMSGSGPTVYAVFEDEKAASRCAKKLKKSFANTYVCSPVEAGCKAIEKII